MARSTRQRCTSWPSRSPRACAPFTPVAWFTATSSRSAVHLPDLAAIPLPKTREFPSWTPRPPRRHPEIEAEDDLASLDD